MSKPAPLDERFEIAVFKKGTSTRGIASERISRDDAQYMVDCGVARWVSDRYKSIIMLAEAVPSKLRDLSCTMGPEVIHANAEGRAFAVALTQAWTA